MHEGEAKYIFWCKSQLERLPFLSAVFLFLCTTVLMAFSKLLLRTNQANYPSIPSHWERTSSSKQHPFNKYFKVTMTSMLHSTTRQPCNSAPTVDETILKILFSLSECSNLLAEIRAGAVWQLPCPRHLQSPHSAEDKQLGGRNGRAFDCLW